MNRLALYIIAVIVAATLLLFTSTFQVRFNQAAVVTTFGEASQQARKDEPGLHFKWPVPIQQVHKYDTRVRTLSTRIENVVTADGQLVAVQVFLSWKISDVLKFYQEMQDPASAESQLAARLRSGLGVFSRYQFRELLSNDPANSKLGQVEASILDSLVTPRDNTPSVSEYGIEPVAVGVTRFILPENTSKSVFERMRVARERLAADARSSGEAEAVRILETANANASKIENFARRVAATIQAEGDRAAAKFLGEQSSDEGLAIRLAELRALEEMMRSGTTVFTDPNSVFRLLMMPPDDVAYPNSSHGSKPAEDGQDAARGGEQSPDGAIAADGPSLNSTSAQDAHDG